MSQEQKARQDINRAVLAEQLLESPLYKEAMLALRADLMDKFTKTKFKQSEERDELWRKMQTADWFENYMQQVVKNGAIAQSTLDMVKQKIKRVI